PTTTENSTLSLHDALPIFWFSAKRWRKLSFGPLSLFYRFGRNERFSRNPRKAFAQGFLNLGTAKTPLASMPTIAPGVYSFGHPRSEEHTSELQSRENLVCR